MRRYFPLRGIADHRPLAVVDLRFLARRGRDDHARFDGRASAQLQHEALDARVPRRGSRGRRPGPARSPPRCARGSAPPRSARGRARRRSHPGARPGAGGHGASPESVDTSSVVAGFDSQSRWTPPPWWPVLTAQGRWTPPAWWPVLPAIRLGRPPRRRTATPAAFRYALAVSRRTPVACSMRRSDQPSRPSARTCCLLLFVQDVAHPGGGTRPHRLRQRLGRYPWWPVFRCPSVAGFGCPPRDELARELGHPGAPPDDLQAALKICEEISEVSPRLRPQLKQYIDWYHHRLTRVGPRHRPLRHGSSSLRERAGEQQDAADEVRAFTMAALAADLGVMRA